MPLPFFIKPLLPVKFKKIFRDLLELLVRTGREEPFAARKRMSEESVAFPKAKFPVGEPSSVRLPKVKFPTQLIRVRGVDWKSAPSPGPLGNPVEGVQFAESVQFPPDVPFQV